MMCCISGVFRPLYTQAKDIFFVFLFFFELKLAWRQLNRGMLHTALDVLVQALVTKTVSHAVTL